MVKVREDMTGWKMWEHGVPDSRLIVVGQSEDDYIYPDGRREAQWLCECVCDNKTQLIASGHNLRCGHTKSCGCLKKELAIKANKKYNTHDLSGEYGILWSTNTNEEIYFDLDDAEEILQYCWSVDSSGYPSASINRKNVRMHAFLDCKQYDHINRNKLDNRRENLRLSSEQDNARNRSKQTNNTSGFIGVYFNKQAKKWRAQITIDFKTTALGQFANKEDAIRARLKAEKEYFGEFAPQRHLFADYNIC